MRILLVPRNPDLRRIPDAVVLRGLVTGLRSLETSTLLATTFWPTTLVSHMPNTPATSPLLLSSTSTRFVLAFCWCPSCSQLMRLYYPVQTSPPHPWTFSNSTTVLQTRRRRLAPLCTMSHKRSTRWPTSSAFCMNGLPCLSSASVCNCTTLTAFCPILITPYHMSCLGTSGTETPEAQPRARKVTGPGVQFATGPGRTSWQVAQRSVRVPSLGVEGGHELTAYLFCCFVPPPPAHFGHWPIPAGRVIAGPGLPWNRLSRCLFGPSCTPFTSKGHGIESGCTGCNGIEAPGFQLNGPKGTACCLVTTPLSCTTSLR